MCLNSLCCCSISPALSHRLAFIHSSSRTKLCFHSRKVPPPPLASAFAIRYHLTRQVVRRETERGKEGGEETEKETKKRKSGCANHGFPQDAVCCVQTLTSATTKLRPPSTCTAAAAAATTAAADIPATAAASGARRPPFSPEPAQVRRMVKRGFASALLRRLGVSGRDADANTLRVNITPPPTERNGQSTLVYATNSGLCDCCARKRRAGVISDFM